MKLVEEKGQKVSETARELDLAEQTLHNWMSKYRNEAETALLEVETLEQKTKKDVSFRTDCVTRRGECDFKKGYGHLHKKPEVIYESIEQHRHEFRVVRMCQRVGR